MGFAVLFPGQGSQFVGMGSDLFDARPDLLGERADEILGWSLRDMCLQGPEEALVRTEHAQPALFALSFALWDELQRHLPTPQAAAGHSLGEYTALAAAGVIDFETGLALVAERGRAMAEAADLEPSGMAALLGVDFDLAEVIADHRRQQGGRLYVANLNAPGQVVLAGGMEDLAWLQDHASDFGVRRVVGLAVAGAFHSPFMAPAAARLEKALSNISPMASRFPVWSNVTAQPVDATTVNELLVRQVVSPVRFAESLRAMKGEGIERFIHVGPGDVTAGMVRKSVPGVDISIVSSLADVGQAAQAVVSISNSGGSS